MKRAWVAVLAILAGSGFTIGKAPAAAVDERAPRPIVHDGESAPAKAWRRAMENADLPALARMYNATTIAFPPDQTEQKGAPTIMKGYEDLFAKYKVLHVAVEDTHWIEKGSLVVSWGLTTLTLQPKAGGADIVSRTRFTDAAVKTESGWLYLVDHASQPTPK